MKQKKSILTVALVAVLIGAAFLFTACWQGTPAGGSGIPGGGGGGSGGGNTASSIEGITWKSETAAATMTLRLKSGNVKATFTVAWQTVSDNGKYKITDDTIKFTGFTNSTLQVMFKEFKYKVEGDTLTLSDTTTGTSVYQFKKA